MHHTVEDGGVTNAQPSVLSKNSARLVVMMPEVLAFLSDTNDVCEQSGDDGTEDQRVREIREHRNGTVIRQAEGPMRTHLIMNSHRLARFQS